MDNGNDNDDVADAHRYQHLFGARAWLTTRRRFAECTKHIESKLRNELKWTYLRGIGLSKAARTSAIWIAVIPVLVRATRFLPNHIIVPYTNLSLNIEIPFSWAAIFYASCCFTIGSAVFALRCPIVIKNFQNYRDFADQTGGSPLALWTIYVDQIWNEKLQHGQDRQTAFDKRLYEFMIRFGVVASDETLHNAMWAFNYHEHALSIPEDRLPDVFEFIRADASTNRVYGRCLCFAFYGLGFFLLACVFLSAMRFMLTQL